MRALARLLLLIAAFVALVVFFSIEFERVNTPDDHSWTLRVGAFAPWLEVVRTDRRTFTGESALGRQIFDYTYGTSVTARTAWSALGVLGFAFLALEKRLKRAAPPR